MSEIRPGRFDMLPVIIKNLLIINGLVFLAQKAFPYMESFDIENTFALHDVRSVFFRPHQLLTYLFMHGDFSHLFFNMFALWMFGSTLENHWGPKRFLIFYLACGIGAGLMHLGVLYFENNSLYAVYKGLASGEQEYWLRRKDFFLNGITVGASGSIFGCLAAFGYLFPNSLIMLYFFFPIKAKWFVIIYGAIELWAGIRNSAGDNVAHWAHLGGALVGILLVMAWNKTKRRNFY